MATHHVVHARRTEEVLLLETQFLSGRDVVVGVEHLRDRLAVALGQRRAHVVAVVEELKIEVVGRLGGPQAQVVDDAVLVARHRRVVGHGPDAFGVGPTEARAPVAIGLRFDATIEIHRNDVLRARHLPGVRELQPVVGLFDLVAFDDLLLEHAVFVADAAAVGRKPQRRARVEEAGGKASETTVAEARIAFHLAQFLVGKRELVKGFSNGVFNPQIEDGISECPSHEEFEREVVDPLDVLIVIGLLGIDPALDKTIANSPRKREIPVVVCGRIAIPGKRQAKVIME